MLESLGLWGFTLKTLLRNSLILKNTAVFAVFCGVFAAGLEKMAK